MRRFSLHAYYVSVTISVGLLFSMCTNNEPNDEQKDSFVKYFGGPYKNEVCNAVIADNHIYILGSVEIESGNSVASVVKTDEYGNVVWERLFGNDTISVSPARIITTKSSGVAFIATAQDSVSKNILFGKLDDGGNIEFEKLLKNENVNEPIAQSLVELENGNFFLCCTCENNAVQNCQCIYVVDAAGNMLRKYPSKGNIEKTQIGTMAQVNSSTTIGVGTAMGVPLLFVSQDATNANMSTIQFNINSGGSYGGRLLDFVQVSDNEILACGVTSDSKGLLMSIDIKSYSENWTKIYGEGRTEFNAITLTSNNELLVVGSHKTENGDNDILVDKLTLNGEVNTERTFGYTGDEVGHAVFETTDNHFIISATFGYENNSVIAIIKDDF